MVGFMRLDNEPFKCEGKSKSNSADRKKKCLVCCYLSSIFTYRFPGSRTKLENHIVLSTL